MAPDFTDAVQNLGCSLFALKRFDDAAQAFAALTRLRPDDAGAQFNLGHALLAANRAAEAVAPLQAAASGAPGQVKHARALAQALAATGRPEAAAAALAAAMGRHGDNPGLLTELACLLAELGRTEAAIGAALMATGLDPDNAGAQSTLARSLHALRQTAQALAPARAALRLSPGDAGAAATLAAVLYTLGQHDEALAHARTAGRLMPGLFQAKGNEALALEALGRLTEAEAAAREAIAMAPNPAGPRHNLAAMLLASGQLTEEAWTLYEARLLLDPANAAAAAMPRWQGGDVAGKTVLLHCEQGFGDTIQFARYAQLVADRGARVVLVVQPELARLMQGTPGAEVLPAGSPLPAFDVFCPLLSLPRAFATTLDSIPSGPTLRPDPALIQRWALPASPALQVGLVWAGSPSFLHDRSRSLALIDLAPLADVPGVAFHSLQLPVQPLDGFPLLDRMPGAADFADTAAMIAGLDLVISVDSAVAHLAASMGKPVWLLSRFMGCWRWLRGRGDSPWYPTMRIYRQEQPNDWTPTIARLREDLVRHAAGAPPGLPPTARRATALDGLDLPAGAPRTVVAIIGENENGILRSTSEAFMDLLPPHGLTGRVVDLGNPNWLDELSALLDRGVLFAWGCAGIGARIPHGDGLLWDAVQVPFVSVLADSPCIRPANHNVPSRWVANGYVYRDWWEVQRRLIRSPQLSAVLPLGTVANPHRAAAPWSSRTHRMLFVKTGRDPAAHRAEWTALPRRFRAVVEDAAAASLAAGVGDVTGTVLDALADRAVCLDGRPDLLFGLVRAVDTYVRDHRSTALVRAVLNLPVDVVGRGWDHVAPSGCRARFHPAVDAAALPALYADTQFLLNTMPNFSTGTHERVLSGFAAGCVVVTNENAEMRARFTALPTYVAIDTEAAGLAEHLHQLFHTTERYDERWQPALALQQDSYGGEAFMRGLIDLAGEVAATPAFEPFRY